MVNLFSYEKQKNRELFETLVTHKGVRIERIVSTGEVTPKGEWYDQDENEWICLVQGEAIIEYEKGETVKLVAGDTLTLFAHQKHRVSYTSCDPACLWIAVFYEE